MALDIRDQKRGGLFDDAPGLTTFLERAASGQLITL